MEPFRFVHAAGLRLDSPFSGLHRPSAPVIERLSSAALDAFENLLELCRAEQVDFLVLAGDAFDANDRGVRAQLRLRDGLAGLAREGIQSFVVRGCADRSAAWLKSVEWPEGVHLFQAGPELREASRGGVALAAIHGVSEGDGGEPAGESEDTPAPALPDLFPVDLRHCDRHGRPLDGTGYLALGPPAPRTDAGGTPGGGAGPLQSLDPGEEGTHGCWLVDVDPDGRVDTRFVPVDVVRCRALEIDVSGLPGEPGLLDALVSRIKEAGSSAEGRDLVCTVTLVGTDAFRRFPASSDDLGRLTDDARLALGFDRPWIWLDRVVDRTSPADDFLGQTPLDELAGLVAVQAAEALSCEGEAPPLLRAALDRLGEHGDGDLLPGADAAELKSWLREAGRLAVSATRSTR